MDRTNLPTHDAETIPALYRLHVKTSCDDREGTLRFCLDRGFLGVGWGAGADIADWSTYRQAAVRRYGRLASSVRAMHDLPDGALIWTRDPTGRYYIGQVCGPWRYLAGDEPRHFDIHNVRPARIVACDLKSAVPRPVAKAFSRGHALERVHDADARRCSAALFAELARL